MPILDQIASALGGNIAGGVTKIIQCFKIDPTVALEKQVEVQEIVLKMQADAAAAVAAEIQGQTEVNKLEAQSKSLFVSGWRPWIGWVCGVAFAYAFVLQPFLTFALVAARVNFDAAKLPVLNISEMLPVLLGMLGLAAARTVEKVNGVDAGH